MGLSTSRPADNAATGPSGTRVARTLRAASAVNAVGDGGFYVVSALYFTRVVGISPGQVGLGLTVAWALGLVTSPLAGRLADWLGLRRCSVGLALAVALALVGLMSAHGPAAFYAAVALYGVTQSCFTSVRQALVPAYVEPERRVRLRAGIQALSNGGLGAGAAIGGLALLQDQAWSYLAVLGVDAMAFAAAAVVLLRLPGAAAAPKSAEGRNPAWRDARYVAATAANTVLTLYMPMLSVLLPLWIEQRTSAPTWLVAALFILNTVGVVALQVPVADRVDGPRDAARSVTWAGALLLVSCLVLGASACSSSAVIASCLLVAGVLVQVVAEVALSAGAWSVSYDLADPERPGEYQGVFGMSVPFARMIGPIALITLVVEWRGPGFAVLGLLFVAAGLSLAVLARTAPERTGSSAG